MSDMLQLAMQAFQSFNSGNFDFLNEYVKNISNEVPLNIQVALKLGKHSEFSDWLKKSITNEISQLGFLSEVVKPVAIDLIDKLAPEIASSVHGGKSLQEAVKLACHGALKNLENDK